MKGTIKYEKGTFYQLRHYWHLLLACCLLFPGIGIHEVSAQCSTYSNAGNNVDSPPQLCAPHNFQWRTWYTVLGSPTSVEMEYDWADGTAPVVVTAVNMGSSRFEAVATHSYPRGGDQCNYIPEVRLRVNGVLCESSIQTQNVTVWDIDSENGGVPRIDPLIYRVCLGNDASVTFDDNSIWNCVPASGENDRKNNMARWVQWQYGTGGAGNRIPGVVVDGTPQPYPFDGTVEVLPGPIETSNSTSNTVYVPASTDVADIGKEFEVTLRNWNLCNPYDTDTLDGDYLNPTSGNLNDGDTAPIETTARIIIVERSNPNFNTRLNNASGPITSSFCIGDDIYLQDNTPAITDANFRYEWEIYNDSTGTNLLSSQTGRNRTFAGFSNPGYKMIRLTVRDLNSVGNCGGQIVKHVRVLSTANADIAVSDTNGDPLGALCYDPANPQPFEVAFEDVSTNFNAATATWTWNFFSHDGTAYVQDSTLSGNGTQESFVASYTQPGRYMAELIASASGVNCETRDTAYVNIYHQPVAAFTADLVCVSDSTTFTLSSNLPQSINGDQLNLYEWDYDYDGNTFDVDHSATTAATFKHLFATAGTYRVAHRVSTSMGTCSAIYETDVNVLSTAIADIAVSDTNGDPLGALCYDPANPQPFEVAFEDVSTNFNAATATWTWNFFSHDGTAYVQDSTLSGNGTQESFVASYTQPGRYMAELIASASGVNCQTRDTAYVNIYHQPVAAFTADLVCVGDSTTFTLSSNLPQSVNGDQLNLYEWDYDYDGNTFDVDHSATTAATFKHLFATAGTYRVAHRVSTSMGTCSAIYETDVNVLSTAIADIAVSDTNGDPLGALCYDPANPQPFEVAFEDVSTNFNAATATWTWNFFSHDGSAYVQDSTLSGNGTQESFVASYTQPGRYMAELIASAGGVSCETRDTSYVFIYQKPTAGFTADPLCASDTTVFTSTAALGQSVNGDQINLYEWDFNYDGINFDVDYSATTADPFKYSIGAAGTYRVAHRVSTSIGNCSALYERDVVILPIPDPGFTASQTAGCSPLEVTFSLNTLLTSQPAQVASYEWFIRDLSDNSVSSQLINPAVDTFATSFLNTLSTFTDHTYEVWVRANASNGCSVESDPQTISVFSGPSATFSIMNLSGLDANCSPRPYDFRVDAVTRNLNPDQYFWTITDLADSSIVVDTTLAAGQSLFSYTLRNDTTIRKKYSVRLLAAKNGFCFSSSERIVDVNPLPSADFTYEIIEADCQLVRYRLKATQGGVDYTWSVMPQPLNTPDMSQQTIELLYRKSLSGSFPLNVSLQTENLVGCESLLNQQQIIVDPQENIGASFTVDPSIMEIPNKTVTISNTTNAGDWSYFWDFGDGTTSSEANPGSHTYETHGEYMIRMRAEGAYCYQEDSAMVIIKQTLPQIDFSFSTIEGCLPLEVTFFNQSLYADTASFFWDFGDGTTSTELNPVHTYTESGIYTISLQASNELNVVMKKEVDLVVDLNKGPKADFLIRMAQAYLPGQAVLFSNQSQRSETFFWDFGDGITSSEENPSHAYEEVGIYEIMLVASNSLGCSDTLRKEIQIEPFHPEVDFTYEPPKGCRPLTVQFRNLSRFVEPGTYRWNFGEGEGVSSQENPTYTYYEPGIYTVTLEASNSAGVTKTSVKEFSVEVYETPRAAFNLRPQEAFLTEPVYFVNLSLGGENYYWDFGDGNTSTEYEPEHVYEETGIYDVTLVVESNKGCTDTLKLESAVIIKNGGKVNVPNAFTPSTSGPGGTDALGPNTKNDVFLPVFEGVTKYHLMIYNRWGEMLFETFDKSVGWDGYYKGRLCAKDVYVYKLELQMSNGESRTLVGDVTLIR